MRACGSKRQGNRENAVEGREVEVAEARKGESDRWVVMDSEGKIRKI